MISFHNPGEIDPRLITTFGAHVKEGENPIGFFGTGLKYALSGLLRLEQKIVIWSGEERFDITAREEEIRGKSFQMLYMNEVSMGFTTEVGKNWEPWMMYRELYCNAKDEGGQATNQEIRPLEGTTCVQVTGSVLEAIHAERGNWFLESQPIWTCEGVECHPGHSSGVFYRGIRVASRENKYQYTYNILEQMTLTEDRTCQSWYYEPRIAKALVSQTDQSFFRRTVLEGQGWLEQKLDFSYGEISEEVAELVSEFAVRRRGDVPQSLLQKIESQRPKEPELATLSEVEQKMLNRALEFWVRLGVQITHEINCVEGLGKGILGEARDGQIWIAKAAFRMGTKYVANTLLEEHLHLTEGVRDCTLGMQNLLFDIIVSFGEERLGEPL